LLGELGTWGLFGTLSVQVYTYYQAFPNDNWSTKSLVYLVSVIELVDTILMMHSAFSAFEYGFGSFTALTNIDFDWLSIPIMGCTG
ncbi:hypothetical protein B0H17DRAFT_957637, partial [Mycena rosella]